MFLRKHYRNAKKILLGSAILLFSVSGLFALYRGLAPALVTSNFGSYFFGAYIMLISFKENQLKFDEEK